MATSHILRNIRFRIGALLVGYIYFVYSRSVVKSGSSESNNDSNCDSESTDNWYFWSKI